MKLVVEVVMARVTADEMRYSTAKKGTRRPVTRWRPR
jgi:hypothetical protein